MPISILKHVEERGETKLERVAEVADAYSLLVRSLGRVETQARSIRPSSYTPLDIENEKSRVTRSQSKTKQISSTPSHNLKVSLKCLHKQSITREEFIKAQRIDPTLANLRLAALEDKNLSKLP
ncbi:hypothetical protein Pmani_000158 [Petrolisthes manimaculis]|uniref:Uncharacterized protein n=1 Tax=Petrolisthes manimaculis TaxID=1843537 RepID=A0AAE1QMJ2_9EUCA|nr:hypothetical protein Pmani_000158 [Petrolisthes manimaculis]